MQSSPNQLSLLPQEGTHCYVLYIRHSCDPVFPTQTIPSFYSISGSSYSIHNWYRSRLLNHKTSISPLLICTAKQHSPCWDTSHSTAFFKYLTTTCYTKEVSSKILYVWSYIRFLNYCSGGYCNCPIMPKLHGICKQETKYLD